LVNEVEVRGKINKNKIMSKTIKQWSVIFRALGNQNRLQILKLLKSNKQMSVGEIKDKLNISFKNTSRNLHILADLDLLRFEGKKDRVYYYLNQQTDSLILFFLENIK